MDENQAKAIQKLNARFIDELEIDEIIFELEAQEVFTTNHLDPLKTALTESERRQKLLDIITNIDNAWNPFLNALDKTK